MHQVVGVNPQMCVERRTLLLLARNASSRHPTRHHRLSTESAAFLIGHG
jgi:hypothetical protein